MLIKHAFALATKSENASFTSTFWVGAMPIMNELVCNVCEVVEFYGFDKVVVAPLSVRLLFLHYIQFIAHFKGSFQEKSSKKGIDMDVEKK